MAEDRTTLVTDELQSQLTEQELGSLEEVRRLKQQLAHIYQAWMTEFLGIICVEKEYKDFFNSAVAEYSTLALDPNIEDDLVRRIKGLLAEEKTFEIDGGSVKVDAQTSG
ncbi:hypothetical protein HAX54_029649 [Datura stramonium]|uniref:Uncharacterized protein n=1 Tax=Datura stramonium TaxID=4076 RepID=A0ABS8SAB7_DATST|nr:hypothetical protein [Datura stramonium]